MSTRYPLPELDSLPEDMQKFVRYSRLPRLVISQVAS